MNKWDEMRDAFREAEQTVNAADEIVDDMAKMLVGRLRKINTYYGTRALQSLKIELRDFNIQTQKWKSRS